MSFNMLASLFLLAVIGSNMMAVAQQTCPDLSPCTISSDCNTASCVEVPMDDVKTIFSNLASPIDINQLTLYIQSSGDSIPADLLGQSRVTNMLSLVRPSSSYVNTTITVDSNAFRSSKDTLQSIEIKYLDASQLDFSFLEGSTTILSLDFTNVSNLGGSLTTLPSIPTLTILKIDSSTGLNEGFSNINLQTNGLTEFEAVNCELDDMGMDQLLNWVLPSSTNTLLSLSIGSNRLTSIPHQLKSFQKLEFIDIKHNKVDLNIPANSFNMQDNGRYNNLMLYSSRVKGLEAGAFQGSYISTGLSLQDNLLDRFEEGVFKSMLQDIYTGDSAVGYKRFIVYISGNSFDCFSDPCHLAWLVRDNRHLMEILNGGICKNGTAFEDLSLDLFLNCDDFITDGSTMTDEPTSEATDGSTAESGSTSDISATTISTNTVTTTNYALRPTFKFYFILSTVSLIYYGSI